MSSASRSMIMCATVRSWLAVVLTAYIPISDSPREETHHGEDQEADDADEEDARARDQRDTRELLPRWRAGEFQHARVARKVVFDVHTAGIPRTNFYLVTPAA